jgi:hypothetical protein
VLAQYYHTGTVPLHAWLHAQQTVFARQQRTRSAAAVAASCRVLQHGFRSCFACNHACPPSPSLPPGCSLAGHAVACVGLPSRNRHRSASFLLPDAGPPGGSVVHLLWSCTCCMPLLAGSVAPLRWGGSCPAGPAATTPSSPPGGGPPPPPPCRPRLSRQPHAADVGPPRGRLGPGSPRRNRARVRVPSCAPTVGDSRSPLHRRRALPSAAAGRAGRHSKQSGPASITHMPFHCRRPAANLCRPCSWLADMIIYWMQQVRCQGAA